jgi:membrane protease YdiL (CAAX protease family)
MDAVLKSAVLKPTAVKASVKADGNIHAAVLLAGLGAVMSRIGWPWYLAVPLLAYALVVVAWPRLRRTAPRLALGRVNGWPLAASAALSVVTVGVLIVFQMGMRPDVSELGAGLPVSAFGNLLWAGVCFSVVNALFEELIFRGVLWEAAAAEWNVGVALGATSLLFGVGHLHGYPPGPLGAVLAGLFGFALGMLRWWTGGLGLAIAVHICADATIFSLLASAGAFGP